MSYQPVLALGYLQPHVAVFPTPVVAARDPTTTDINYPIGQEWVNSSSHVIWFLTNIAAGSATWVNSTTAGAINTITGNSGGAESPSGGNFNILGTGSITVAGSAATETVQLIGLTNHNVLVGAGTATITKVAPSATSGVPLISQGAAADPVFGTAVVAGGGTGAVTLTAHGVLIGEGTSAVVATTAGTNGQVLVGSTGADPAFTTLTSSTGVTFTGGAHTLAVDVKSGGYNVNTVSGTSGSLAVQNSYVCTNAGATTLTLPATAAVGDMIIVTGSPANTAGWVIAQNAGQTIHKEASASTTGATGTVTSAANANESLLLMCTVANTDFIVMYSNGTLAFA